MRTVAVSEGTKHPYGNASPSSCLITPQCFLDPDGRISVDWCNPTSLSEASESWLKSWVRRIKNAMVIGFLAIGTGAAATYALAPDLIEGATEARVTAHKTIEQLAEEKVGNTMYRNEPVLLLTNVVAVLPSIETDVGTTLSPGLVNPIIFEHENQLWLTAVNDKGEIVVANTNELVGYCSNKKGQFEAAWAVLGANNVHNGFALSGIAKYAHSVDAVPGRCATSISPESVQAAFTEALRQ